MQNKEPGEEFLTSVTEEKIYILYIEQEDCQY